MGLLNACFYILAKGYALKQVIELDDANVCLIYAFLNIIHD